MTNVFYDTEFLEDGITIELISIGMIADDGSKYYAVNSDINDESTHHDISHHRWLMENVIPHLPLTREGITKVSEPESATWQYVAPTWRLDLTSTLVKPGWVIANEVRDYLQGLDNVKLWADYGAYDHVALCQLFGPMIDLPDGIPMWTHDLRMLMELSGLSDEDIPPYQNVVATPHDSFYDARELKWRYDYIKQHLTGREFPGIL